MVVTASLPGAQAFNGLSDEIWGAFLRKIYLALPMPKYHNLSLLIHERSDEVTTDPNRIIPFKVDLHHRPLVLTQRIHLN